MKAQTYGKSYACKKPNDQSEFPNEKPKGFRHRTCLSTVRNL